MDSTQSHLPISDIAQDLLLLQDGGAALILQTGAVNFGLLSEREQLAIIGAFAQMLNSLSFPLQIIIDSKKLDISSYIEALNKAQIRQTNALLSDMIARYREFIKKTVKENEVLDKRFYVVITISHIELGIGTIQKEELLKRASNILIPRRDQVIRQLNRVGLKGSQLNNQELFELFYEIYNRPLKEPEKQVQIAQVRLSTPQMPIQTQTNTPAPTQPVQQNQTINQNPSTSKNHPFVVEELPEQ